MNQKDNLKLNIFSQDKEICDIKIEKITLPGVDGSFQILKNHAPMVACLKKGNICWKSEEQEKTTEVKKKALVKVQNNHVQILIVE